MESEQFVIIRYKGRIHKIRKAPYESDEYATLRAWYIVKELPDSMTMIEKESRSQIWINIKYFGMIYRYDQLD